MSNINNGVFDGVRRVGARVRDLIVDGGLPGAPYGLRVRGATGTGWPQTGTWKAGDHVEDRAGNVWICTAGGKPGTWVQSGWGRRSKLQGWYAGLASRPSAAVTAVVIGDSVTEGANATAWSNAYPAMLQTALNARFPTPGLSAHGRGFLAPVTAVVSFSLPYISASTGPSAGPAVKTGFGLNARGYDLSAGLAGSVGTNTAPPSFTALTGSPFVPAAGTYTANWSVTLGSGATSNDANNFRIINNVTTLATSVNAGAAGTYEQTPVTFTADGTHAIYIGTAGNAGTGGVVYTGTIDPGCSFTYSLTGDNAIILYANQSGGGSFKYKVDSGSYTTVSTSGTAADGQFSGPVSLGGGAHTLTIKHASGGADIFEGVVEYNGDIGSGVQVYNCGTSGSTAAQWATSWYTTANTGLTTPATALAVLQPNLIIIELGVNDYGSGNSPADLYTNLKTFIATVRAAFPSIPATAPPFLLLATPQPDNTGAWAPYLAALYALAASDPLIDILDLTLRMPVFGTGQQWNTASGGEYGDVGHSMIADAICEFLSPA